MIKRLEAWLQRIIRDEVNVARNDFAQVSHTIKALDSALATEREKFLAAMRNTIADDLKQFRADLVAERLLVAEPSHWKASAADLQEADQLRKKR
jgi:hypothetical protein